MKKRWYIRFSNSLKYEMFSIGIEVVWNSFGINICLGPFYIEIGRGW